MFLFRSLFFLLDIHSFYFLCFLSSDFNLFIVFAKYAMHVLWNMCVRDRERERGEKEAEKSTAYRFYFYVAIIARHACQCVLIITKHTYTRIAKSIKRAHVKVIYSLFGLYQHKMLSLRTTKKIGTHNMTLQQQQQHQQYLLLLLLLPLPNAASTTIDIDIYDVQRPFSRLKLCVLAFFGDLLNCVVNNAYQFN